MICKYIFITFLNEPELIFLHTVVSDISNTSISIYY